MDWLHFINKERKFEVLWPLIDKIKPVKFYFTSDSNMVQSPTLCATPIMVMGYVMGLPIFIAQWGLLSDCYKVNPIDQ